MTLLPQGVRALEEFENELDGFEAGERAPSGAYFGDYVMNGMCCGFGCLSRSVTSMY